VQLIEEIIEAMCKAAWNVDRPANTQTWAELDDEWRDKIRDQMRAALGAIEEAGYAVVSVKRVANEGHH
jgi:predicted GNAT superfamily acetyltransferase